MVAKAEKRKKPFKVIGVNAVKNYASYAKKIETSLNKMKEDGYALRVVNITEKGALICGEFVPPNQHPFSNALRAVEEHAPEEVPDPKHPETIRICNYVMHAMGNAPRTEYRNILAKIGPEFCKAKTPTELLTIADDIEQEAKHHLEHHNDPQKTCVIPEIFNATVEYLRAIGKPGIN